MSLLMFSWYICIFLVYYIVYRLNIIYCLFGKDQTSDSKELNFEISLEDLETIKVIGKGSGGVVQLVRHKWVGNLFALKVSPLAKKQLLFYPFCTCLYLV